MERLPLAFSHERLSNPSMGRLLLRAVVLVVAMMALAGCDGFNRRGMLRSSAMSEPKLSDAAPYPVIAGESGEETTSISAGPGFPEDDRPFFKSNRLSGGLSSEAADIERSLGVSP